MLDFAIFAVCFVVFLLVLVFYLYPGSARETSIPGIDPSDPKEGNVGDVLQAGGLQNFLVSLHKVHGPIASFWMGTQFVVSLGDPELFKKHIGAFDKPVDLFALYKPLVGGRSILFANGIEGRKRRIALEKIFHGDACNKFVAPLQELCGEVVNRWSKLPSDQHIPVFQYMFALCMKSCTRMFFGEHFHDDKNVLEFSRTFEVCLTELEERAGGLVPDADSPRQKKFTEAICQLRRFMKDAIDKHKSANESEKDILLDVLSGPDIPEDQAIDDCLTFVMKYYSLAVALTWAIYFLATHTDVQDTVAEEVKGSFEEQKLSPVLLSKLKTVQKVIMETLRTAVVEPWTARYQDIDVELGGHMIPKQTPVIDAIGVVLQSSDVWSLPKKFDLSHFDAANLKDFDFKFCPFGFAGKRGCPAKDLAYLQMSVLICMVCSKFHVTQVEGQVVTPQCRLVTKPEDEVWVMLKKRP